MNYLKSIHKTLNGIKNFTLNISLAYATFNNTDLFYIIHVNF